MYSIERINAWQVPEQLNNYRYRLGFEINSRGKGRMLFIGLNPSTATLIQTDPTVDSFARGIALYHGFKELEVVNLFGYRSTSKKKLLQVKNPVGYKNDDFIAQAVRSSDCILIGWGMYFHPMIYDRAHQVLEVVKENARSPLRVIGLNSDGSPRHPLYQKIRSPLMKYPF